jgi:hypothetical protein
VLLFVIVNATLLSGCAGVQLNVPVPDIARPVKSPTYTPHHVNTSVTVIHPNLGIVATILYMITFQLTTDVFWTSHVTDGGLHVHVGTHSPLHNSYPGPQIHTSLAVVVGTEGPTVVVPFVVSFTVPPIFVFVVSVGVNVHPFTASFTIPPPLTSFVDHRLVPTDHTPRSLPSIVLDTVQSRLHAPPTTVEPSPPTVEPLLPTVVTLQPIVVQFFPVPSDEICITLHTSGLCAVVLL